jgi:hypothetical protein
VDLALVFVFVPLSGIIAAMYLGLALARRRR